MEIASESDQMDLETKRRNFLSIHDKLKIIKHRDSGASAKEIAKHFGVGASSVRKILQKGDYFKEFASKNPYELHLKRIKQSKFSSLDSFLLKWINQSKAANYPISGTAIQEKASEFAERLGITEFSASNGWLGRFKERNGLSIRKRTVISKDDESEIPIVSLNQEDDEEESSDEDESFESFSHVTPKIELVDEPLEDPISEVNYDFSERFKARKKEFETVDGSRQLLESISADMKTIVGAVQQQTQALMNLSRAVVTLSNSFQSYIDSKSNDCNGLEP